MSEPAMRLARVLSAASPQPILALERDGALYSVSALEKWYVTAYSPDTFATSSDFRSRVVALGGAGLAELDERLASGVRPSDARLVEGSFLWLPPSDDERAALVEVDVFSRDRDATPAIRLGSARSLVGHQSAAPLCLSSNAALSSSVASSSVAGCSAALAVILSDDLLRASPAEAERAMFAITPMLRWHSSPTDIDARAGREASGREMSATSTGELAAHLGPVLQHPIVPAPLFPSAAARTGAAGLDPSVAPATLRVGEAVYPLESLASAAFSLAEAVALASHRLPLRAGDVVAVGPIPRRVGPGRVGPESRAAAERVFEVELGQSVSFWVEGLCALDGRAVDGSEPARWRDAQRG
jgi:hypothetical protein